MIVRPIRHGGGAEGGHYIAYEKESNNKNVFMYDVYIWFDDDKY